MLYMVIEHFKNANARPVYERYRSKGRLAPAGIEYVASWVDEDLSRCFQVMQTDDPKRLHEWMGNWADLVDFEVIRVMTTADALRDILEEP